MNNTFTTHYYLNDNTHQMDAFIRNRCEYKVISTFFYCFNIYGIRAKLESLPKEEGGIIEHLKIISDNKEQIELLLLALTTFFTGYPFFRSLFPDEEKELQKRKALLEIKKLENELDNNKNESLQYTAKDLVDAISRDSNLILLLSDFYTSIKNEGKVTKIGFKWDKNEKTIERDNFEKLIISNPKTVENPSEIITIELISPVLKKKKFKWKGIIDGEPKNFTMKDQKFSKLVREKAFSFQNGDSITASVIQKGEVDFNGEWSKIEYIVEKVHSVYSGGINIKVDTPMPEKSLIEQHQLHLFIKK